MHELPRLQRRLPLSLEIGRVGCVIYFVIYESMRIMEPRRTYRMVSPSNRQVPAPCNQAGLLVDEHEYNVVLPQLLCYAPVNTQVKHIHSERLQQLLCTYKSMS
ncbi:unnamed protein product [Dicrocoelium dendriticum]|nr:unnamed protein product [Dicrocoelium dendriticum]